MTLCYLEMFGLAGVSAVLGGVSPESGGLGRSQPRQMLITATSLSEGPHSLSQGKAGTGP